MMMTSRDSEPLHSPHRESGYGTTTDPLSMWKHLVPATFLLRDTPNSTCWSLDNLAGRFVEVSGYANGSALSQAATLLRHIQERGETAAWITDQRSSFFPPDFAKHGIDLAALPVMRTRHMRQATQIADLLLRCSGFSLVVMDLHHHSELPLPSQTRLSALAKKHHSIFLCLTHTNRRHSLGSLVSLHGTTHTQRTHTDRFTSRLQIIKDKRHGPGHIHKETYRGPDGLC